MRFGASSAWEKGNRLPRTCALLALVGFNRPLQFGMSIGAVLLAANCWFSPSTDVIHQERSFFGVLRVKEDLLEQHGARSFTARPSTVSRVWKRKAARSRWLTFNMKGRWEWCLTISSTPRNIGTSV